MVSKFNHEKSARWVGHWWLPEDPERRIPGILEYEPDTGLLLTLVGGYQDPRLEEQADGSVLVLAEGRPWPAIYGNVNGQDISLLDCILRTSTRRVDSSFLEPPPQQTVGASAALLGAHVSGLDVAAFDAVEVSVEHLTRWANLKIVTWAHESKDDRLTGGGTVRIRPVAPRWCRKPRNGWSAPGIPHCVKERVMSRT
jgi:hypothetical protein